MSMPAEQLPAEMTLAELLHGYVDAPDLGVAGISSDSRSLQEGDLFLACQGLTSHGIDYIDDAIAPVSSPLPRIRSTAAIAGAAIRRADVADRKSAQTSWQHR